LVGYTGLLSIYLIIEFDLGRSSSVRRGKKQNDSGDSRFRELNAEEGVRVEFVFPT
jgi:hypothetical protein